MPGVRAVVPKVEPPSTPSGVVRRHLARDVEVLPVRAHVQRQATGTHELLRLTSRVLDEEFAAEQMDP